MKHRLTCITAMTLFGALAIPVRLAAQEEQQDKQQPRYKVVDMGTFGGSDSSVNGPAVIINNRGTAIGSADTSVPDPFTPNCFDPECFSLTHSNFRGVS